MTLRGLLGVGDLTPTGPIKSIAGGLYWRGQRLLFCPASSFYEPLSTRPTAPPPTVKGNSTTCRGDALVGGRLGLPSLRS